MEKLPEGRKKLVGQATSVSILRFGVGGSGGRWCGDCRRKSSVRRGPRGMAGAAVDRQWGVVSGRAGWPRVAGAVG